MNTIEGESLTTQFVGDQIKDQDSAITPLLLFSVFIAVCGSFAIGCATGYSSPVESEIMEELGLSTAQFSLFGSILTVGGLLGSLISGKITDLIGRRGAMGLSDTLSLLGWIAISISQKAWLLDVGRFFVGASIGLLFYVVSIYTAEITPKNLRGQLASLSQLMMSSGIGVMFFFGSMISWRILVLIAIIPTLVQLFGLFFIPESPRFLAKYQSTGHKIVLQRLRGCNVDISREVADIEEFTQRLQHIQEVDFIGLFQIKYARDLLVVFGLMALGGVAGPTAVLYYASSVFESAGFSTSWGPIIMAFVQVPSAAIGAYLIDKFGRRPLLMISAAAMCFCCFLVGLMFLLKEKDYLLGNVCPYFIALGLWGYSAAFRLGMAGIPFLIMSEIFPMNVKGSAGSLAVVVSLGSSWLISYTFNFMTEWSYSGTFFILGALNAYALLFTARLVQETKGKTLEELQN